MEKIEVSDLISKSEVHKILSLLATEGGKDAKLLLSDAHEMIDGLPTTQFPPYMAEIEEEYKKAIASKWKKHDREDANRHE